MAPLRKLKIAHVPKAEGKQAPQKAQTSHSGPKELDAIEQRRNKLTASFAIADVQAVARAASQWSLQELSFDVDLMPALAFVETMGLSVGDLFTHILTDLTKELASCITSANALEAVVKQMEQHAGSAKIAAVILPALDRLPAQVPSPVSSLRDKVIRTLAKSPEVLKQLPKALNERVFEASEDLWKPKLHGLLGQLVTKWRRSIKPHDGYAKSLQEVTTLLERTRSRQQLCQYITEIQREAASYKTVTLREPVQGGSENTSDPKKEGRPVTHGPEPFLSTLKRTILMNAVQTNKLSQTVVGSWHLEVKLGENPEKVLSRYKLVLEQGPNGTLTGNSELKGITAVAGKVVGNRLTFDQTSASGTVYHCQCTFARDQLVNGIWRSSGPKPMHGTFTGERKGRAPFVDAGGTEWDPLTDFVRAVGTLQMNERLFVSKTKPMSMKDLDPLIKALKDILVGQDAVTSFKMEEEVSASLADPFVLQFLVDNLIQQVVTSTPANGEDLSPEASYLLVMLYAAAQFGCPKDGGRRLMTSTYTTELMLSMGLRVDNLAVALQLYRSEGDLRQTNFKEYMGSLKICALGVKPKYVDRAMTTLRLLLAVLTSSALQQKKIGHFRECLALASEWRSLTNQPKLCKPNKMVDWIDRLLVDWMLNTVKDDARYPTIQWAFREPLFEYLGTLAQEDPGVCYGLTLIYKDVYYGFANAREEFRFIRDKVFAGRCFKNSLYDWSKDIAGIYAPLLINKEYLHQYYEECGLAAACRVPPEERRPPPPPVEPEEPAPQVVVILDDPDKLTMHRNTLEAVDSVLGLRVAQTVHEYCKHAVVDLSITMQEASAQVIEMLTKNYAGTPWICNLAAGWIAQLKNKDNDEDATACGTLRKCIARRMVSHFDQERADKLTNRSQPNPSVPWLDGFIKVQEWRTAIYELANESRGRSSRFVSGLLVQIAEADKNFDEVMKLNSTSESFQLFIRKMRELILRVLTVTNVDETLIKDDLDAFCDAATHKQYTYIYSQGILRGLISMCPLQRQPLQCLSEVLTDYHKSNHAVLRVDLRLSPVGQYPELSQLLHSMCRFGGTPHFDAKDVETLCKQVEGLLSQKGPSAMEKSETRPQGTKRKAQEVPERPKRGSPSGQGKNSKRKKAEEEFSPSKKKKAEDSDSDAKTEVASDACSWGAKTPATKAAAKKKKEDDSSGPSEGDASNSQQQTDRTDSIWHWPAPSAVAASERDVRDDFDPTKGLRGILETLRSKVFFEALLTRFVDPSSNLKMTPAQINSYARLMALCCHDGLLADADSESWRTAQKAVLTSTKELEEIHRCVRDPLLSWFRKMPKIAQLQQTALGCAAGLRWVQHVVLSDRLPQQQLLTRLAQPVIYQMLKSAWTAHPKKPTAGRILMIARQILESFTATENSVASQEEDDEPWEPMSSVPGEQEVGLNTGEPAELRKRACRNISGLLVFVANSAQLHVQVTDLVRETMDSWEKEAVSSFVSDLLTTNCLPYSRRFNWALILLLASADSAICLGKEDFLQQAKHALQDHPQQPDAIQKRICAAKEAWKVVALRASLPVLPVPEVAAPEAPRRLTKKTRPQPQPKGRTVPPPRLSEQDLQGRWLHSRLGAMTVEGDVVRIGAKTFKLIKRRDGFACGGYCTQAWTPVMITWTRPSGTLCTWTRG